MTWRRMTLTLTSSMTRGTQPPKTNIRVPIMVAEWRERGRGAIPASWGLLQVIVSGGGRAGAVRLHATENRRITEKWRYI
jgi:hypothetical protein